MPILSDSVKRPVVVLGLDCVPPLLAFDRYRHLMPTLSGLVSRGLWGPLRSTTPPITVPAWASMTSGRDPGELGLYGFRNRKPMHYDLAVATSRDVRVKRIWDLAGEAGHRVAALFVPPSSPPRPVRGTMLSCFMHPGGETPFAFPAGRGTALSAVHGPYRADVEGFRTEDKARVLEELYSLGKQHFAMARDVLLEERPSLFFMVEIGPDRLHHALWAQIDEAHPRFDPSNPWRYEGERYYAFLDEQIASVLEIAGRDAAVMIVSDHGARPMLGAVRLNEYLRRTGWLVLKRDSATGHAFSLHDVDWTRTRAWGAGGYYGRVFLNVAGREPQGIIQPDRSGDVIDELVATLQGISRDDGTPVRVECLRPEEIYRQTQGFPPDLLVFFEDLALRATGSFDSDHPIVSDDNDSGPDGCNHDWDGIFVLAGSDLPRGHTSGLSIFDVNATLLGLLGLQRRRDLLGVDRSIAS